jgi:hypothetical protein
MVLFQPHAPLIAIGDVQSFGYLHLGSL